MHLAFKIIIFFTAFINASISIAQDNVPFISTDSLYREDQFYIGFTYNLLSSVPDNVKVRGLSGGIHFGYVRDMPINKKRTIAIGVGLGLAYDQFGQNLVIDQTPNGESTFTVLTDDVEFDANRFSMYIIEAPIEFRWRSSSPNTYKFWRVHGGLRVGYAYYYKSTFKQLGNNFNQTNISEFDPVRLAATLSFGYNTFNFYANYSINPFFKEGVTTSGDEVSFKTIKVGLIFYLL